MDDESTQNLEPTLGEDLELENEPTLPGIPCFPDVYRGKKTIVNSRKRPHIKDAQQYLSTSSDPAVFSSDDDPALENVSRRKKRYVGSWFQQVATSSDSALGDDVPSSPSRVLPKRKRTLRRQFDSGVYVGHAGVVDSSDGEPDTGSIGGPGTSDVEGIDDPARPDTVSSRGPHAGDSEEEPGTYLRRRGPYRSNPHSDAYCRRLAIEMATPKHGADEPAIQNYFQALIEHGEETVDISNIGIRSISNATTSLLSGLVRIPTVIEDVEFEQPETSINLIMSKNLLARVPTAIFELEHLTTLSLRNNKLVELPPSISKCKSLQSLNVSFNRLRYLPGELLELMEEGGSLQELHVVGNPFYQLKESTYQSEELDESGPDEHFPSKMYRTAVQYTDTTGAVYSDFRLDDRQEVEREPDSQLAGPRRARSSVPPPLLQQANPPPPTTRTPSLLELALRSASRASRNDASLAPLLGPASPDHLRALLDAAADARYQGLPRCRACGRAFVRARAQWLEFLADRSGAGPLEHVRIDGAPFLRRGCSWACVPRVVVPRGEGEGPGGVA